MPTDPPEDEIAPDETPQVEPVVEIPKGESPPPVAVEHPPDDAPAWAKKLIADVDQLTKGIADDKAKAEARSSRRTTFKESEGKARAARELAAKAKRAGARLFRD